MIFFQLFYTFLIIGAFTFGGGYSMIALIEGEVVGHWGWMSAQEFTDLLALWASTPPPMPATPPSSMPATLRGLLSAGHCWPLSL